MMTMTPADLRVKTALGARFEEFQKLARMAVEQPATRPYVESQMARLLGDMSDAQRVELREALRAAGAYKRKK